MKSKVFSVRFFNYPNARSVVFYRTNGRLDGGGYRVYAVTTDRLIRLLRVMCSVSDRRLTCIGLDGEMTTWTIAGIVAAMYEAQAKRTAEGANAC